MLKHDRFAVMFFGWTRVDTFFEAWKGAGFQPVAHLVFRKGYSSLPDRSLGDVLEMSYSGNKLTPRRSQS